VLPHCGQGTRTVYPALVAGATRACPISILIVGTLCVKG
jgi:hypothetical protein